MNPSNARGKRSRRPRTLWARSLLLASDVSRLSQGTITPAAVRAAEQAGHLKARKTQTGTRLFRLADVVEWFIRRELTGQRRAANGKETRHGGF